MMTVPLVAVLTGIAWLMIAKGGWKAAPVVMGFAVGLTMAATPFGPDFTQLITQVTDSIAKGLGDMFGGGR